MTVTPTGSASSLAALYAALSAASGSTTTSSTASPTTTSTAATTTSTAASGVTATTGTTTSSDSTITSRATLDQEIATEQLSYLVSMQSTLQDDFLSTGIVTPQEGALLFGSTSDPFGLVAPSTTSDDAVQSLIVTPGLSDLAIKVLTGQTTLESVVAAGTQARQNAVTATQVAAAYGANGSTNDSNTDTDADTEDDGGDTDS